MAEHSLLDLYDLSKEGEALTVDFPGYPTPFRVSSLKGHVYVYLVEDTSVETTLNPNKLEADEFEDAVFEFVDGHDAN